MNEKLTNLGCRRKEGLYMPPRKDDVGKHFLKTAGAHAYVWSILVDGMKPNATRCIDMSGDGRL